MTPHSPDLVTIMEVGNVII